jgi:hypothetical protein
MPRSKITFGPAATRNFGMHGVPPEAVFFSGNAAGPR